ncbi:uncharacterized protein PGTG_17354 [Puccinia graminis f. sp. tritici CRL 75-36-700-3]|uniref:Kinesin motor domain-containing protein n=1 Tax=Puccinia graminis f. sp. tritici (strain CRL 75-36-700-3 / race SCCL) TaxID=418459 RepID=E3L4C3_PUCGT|nr:uncharacterized protein PGTG_17354 [Puccinia graminis f. sp. tritici CRL 75-36-700-3]EFP91398.1 hypothetical protein PGTG_17354 [Puccinia graminis f. sp. tritici CRL 75-36-700-3]
MGLGPSLACRPARQLQANLPCSRLACRGARQSALGVQIGVRHRGWRALINPPAEYLSASPPLSSQWPHRRSRCQSSSPPPQILTNKPPMIDTEKTQTQDQQDSVHLPSTSTAEIYQSHIASMIQDAVAGYNSTLVEI